MRLLIVGFVFVSAFAFGQKKLVLGKDSKYIYYEVVSDSGLIKDSLMNRAVMYFNENEPKNFKEFLFNDSLLEAHAKFIIDKTILIASHPSGEVGCTLSLNTKDGRYRFWLTDFIYIPYVRDRYGNFTAKSTGTPLETEPSKLKAAEWKAIVAATSQKVNEFANNLKKFMSESSKIKVKKDTDRDVIAKDW